MRHVNKVAVLGSGVMGSGIACHLANAGMQVLMLDILPKEGTEEQLEDPVYRNKVATDALAQTIRSKPAPLYKKEFASRIDIGNFEDDLHRIKDYDWVIEVVVEDLEIKRSLLEKVDSHRQEGTLITTNTSGIPIHLIAEGRSDDFKSHFCGTHFFNPPRYLRLLEVIPGPDTKQEILEFFYSFGDRILGKETVMCKDSPAFIANRVGVYAMSYIFQQADALNLPPNIVDKLTGPAIGRPKTGTFRLGDLVGLDVAAKVLKGIQENCPEDQQAQNLKLPEGYQYLLDKNWLGNKTGQGFYKKTDKKDEEGRSIILEFDLNQKEYKEREKLELKSLEQSKQIEELEKRIPELIEIEDKGAELLRRSFGALFAYVSKRIPEISDRLYAIDQAVKAGFNWNYGPFEYWEIIGIEKGVELAEEAGFEVADWVKTMVEVGKETFYDQDGNSRMYYDIEERNYKEVPGSKQIINLRNLEESAPVYENEEVQLHDIGDGVLCLEFRSRRNAIGEGILTGLNESINIAEEGDWKGLVIGNHADNFTVGANLMMIGMMAFQQQWEMLNQAVSLFQNTTMRCRYSSIPVVAATQGYVFGGGCELIMHCDATVCAAESYIGLVEAGVGLLPGGSGTKEFALRSSDSYVEGDVKIPSLIERFKAIATAQVATSAHQAFDYGYLNSKDEIELNLKRNIQKAKKKVLDLSNEYVQPIEREDITVLGRQGLASLYIAANEMKRANYASEHDIKIARKIAWVLCGGDLTGEQQVSERYLIELEREAFLSLCGEQKTLERIQHMLEKNKPLRN
jgi:3-hydroxyacyl-CoA dehydrogenase